MYNLKLAMTEFNRAFPKVAVDAFNQDLLKPTEHNLAANKRDGWQSPDIQGDLEQERDGGAVRNMDMITSSVRGDAMARARFDSRLRTEGTVQFDLIDGVYVVARKEDGTPTIACKVVFLPDENTDETTILGTFNADSYETVMAQAKGILRKNKTLVSKTSADWGADDDRFNAREDTAIANQVRNGLQEKLTYLVNGLYVAPGGQEMTVRKFLQSNPITSLFQSTDRSVRVMGDRIRRELSDYLLQNYDQSQISRFKGIFGANVTDWLVGKKLQAAIHEHTAPELLPPRPDLRSHLSDEAQEAIDKAKGKTAKLLQPSITKQAHDLQAFLVTASVDKLAWSNAIKAEVLRRWGKSQSMPKTTEGQVDEVALGKILDSIEAMVPPGPKQKAYTLYLAGQFFAFNPPAWVPGEDDAVIRPLMFNFDKLVTKGKLTGPQADINGYKGLDQLKAAVGKLMDEAHQPVGGPDVPDEEEAQKPRFDVHRTKYLPQDIADIKAGSAIVAEAGGWAVYKIRANPDEAGKIAAQLLCNNGINKVSWCVGRGTLSYLDQGPFYVLVQGGKSRFAISSVLRDKTATIWNAADTPVWVTTSGDGDHAMPNLVYTAQEKGIPLDLTKISSLPADILPVMAAATQADPELAALVPPAHLVQGDTAMLDKAIMVCSPTGLTQDLSSAFGSERTVGIGAAIMGRCIALHYDFSQEYSEFDETLLVAYIELLAAAGQGLPKSLEAAIIQAIQNAS